VSLSARDRKLLLAIVPIAFVAAFWFLVLAPKREEAKALGTELADAQSQLDSAQASVAQAEQARSTFASDYETVVRLGKAVPAKVDMPSLLVQLDSAARGTGIEFSRVTAGERTAAAAAAAPAAPPAAGGQPAAGQAPAAGQVPAGQTPTAQAPASTPPGGQPAGSDPAASAPGRAADAASGAVADANAGAAQAEAQTGAGQPATPPAGQTAPGATPTTAPGLESVPLDLTFRGRFFELADLLHELKRFVYLDGDEIVVRGRLMTIDQVSFRSSGGRVLDATIKASVFLAPRAEGVTAGATPTGPAPAAPASTAGSPAPTPPTAARIP
jgi:hypothetical protein